MGDTQAGIALTARAKRAGLHRFSQVKVHVPVGHKLFRSSAPGFKLLQKGADRDATQNLTLDTANFLVEEHIDSIISFNKYEYTSEEMERLENASPRIQYLHLPVDDWHAPTLEQLELAYKFFLATSSTLVHCGDGLGRTGTGVTGLQVSAANGQTLRPFASTWWSSQGNNVERRGQMSAIAELRNVLLQNKSNGFPEGALKKEFAIINFATGYYLSISKDGQSVVAASPEQVDPYLSTKGQYRWFIKRDGSTNNFELSNCASSLHFATTKSSDLKVGDPVTNGTGEGANTLFTTTEVGGTNRHIYTISPLPKTDLAIAIKEPAENRRRMDESREMPALLANKDDNNKLGLWLLMPVVKFPSLK